jgi:hypothetical protein
VFDDFDFLKTVQVFGCPCYVLQPTLQDGKKLPKWVPRTRRGQYLGISTRHSSTIGQIRNLDTGHVSPQFHVVYDPFFMTVPNAGDPELVNVDRIDLQHLLSVPGVHQEHNDIEDIDELGNLKPAPELNDEWLTFREQETRNACRACLGPFPPIRIWRRHPPVVREEGGVENQNVLDGADGANEGEQQDIIFVDNGDDIGDDPANDALGVQLETVAAEAENENIIFDNNGDDIGEDPANNALGVQLETVAAEAENDDESIPSMHPADDDLLSDEEDDDDGDNDGQDGDAEIVHPMLHRSKRKRKKNTKTYGGKGGAGVAKASNYDNRKIKQAEVNKAFLNGLDWSIALNAMTSSKSKDYGRFVARVESEFDSCHPLALTMKANAMDTPNWYQAMNGVESDGYWKAMEIELETLLGKDAWVVLD